MSDGSYAAGAGESRTNVSEGDRAETSTSAKEAAVDLKDAATDAAKDVAGTAKAEAASVARETKAQVTDLFHQARKELGDQAANQQQRVADGLGAFGDELGALVRNSDGTGIAADVVQRVSERATTAADWLGSRDPSDVVGEIKSFARRRPAVFIGAALIAGVVAGRLTRALIANAQDDAGGSNPAPAGRRSLSTTPGVEPYAPPVPPAPPVAPPVVDDAPLYSASAAASDVFAEEGSDERPDSF